MSPGRHQAIIWTNAGMSSAKWGQSYLDLDVLKYLYMMRSHTNGWERGATYSHKSSAEMCLLHKRLVLAPRYQHILCNVAEIWLLVHAILLLKEGELTHLPLDKMTIFSGAFSWMKIFVFWLKPHWSLFVMVLLTKTQHWYRYCLGAE